VTTGRGAAAQQRRARQERDARRMDAAKRR